MLRELNWSKLQIPPQQCERLIKSRRKQLFQVCAAKEFLQATESRGRLWFSPAASAVCLEQMLNLLRTRCLFIWPIKLIKDLCGLFLWLIMLNYCFLCKRKLFCHSSVTFWHLIWVIPLIHESVKRANFSFLYYFLHKSWLLKPCKSNNCACFVFQWTNSLLSNFLKNFQDKHQFVEECESMIQESDVFTEAT